MKIQIEVKKPSAATVQKAAGKVAAFGLVALYAGGIVAAVAGAKTTKTTK